MKKHPLLPASYSDGTLQAAILQALKPYETTQRNDVVNPHLKWNLRKAWNDSEELLAKGGWKKKNDDTLSGWELAADSDGEVDNLNRVLAAVVARQIIEEESGYAVRRIEYKKGGEVNLLISDEMKDILQKAYPGAKFIADEKPQGGMKWLQMVIKRLRKYLPISGQA